MPVKKRSPGNAKGEYWLVMTESKKKRKNHVHKCGTKIKGKQVGLSVRDGLFPLSGSGEVKWVAVPYCPKCEKEPTGGEISPEGKISVLPSI